MVAMFISSCVQGDLCDEFYDEDMNWWYSHKKKGKDIGGSYPKDLIAARSYVNSEGFSPCENECYACALYNYSIATGQTKTRYKMRAIISKYVYGINEEWPILYRNSVLFNGGINSNYNQDRNIVSEAVGASPYPTIPSGRDYNGGNVIINNCNHWAVVIGEEDVYVSGVGYIKVYHLKDQGGGSSYIRESDIENRYY